MQQTCSKKHLRIPRFCRWILHFCCSLLLFGATVLASDAFESETTSGTEPWNSGSHAYFPSDNNKELSHLAFTAHDAKPTTTYSHSRVINQLQSEFETEGGFQCGLSSDVIERFYDESSQMWTITDALLNEVNNDLQRMVDCAVQDDVLEFRTGDTIQPSSTMTIRLPLILRGESTATFTCPQQGAFVVSRSASFTMENIMISGCNGTSSIVILNPSCNGGRLRSITRLTSVSFEDNGVFDQGHLIEANSSCLQLDMTGVMFTRNRCIGTHCVSLGSRTTLRNIRIENNHGSNDSSLDSSIFAASIDSQTIATNVTSIRNEIRSFHISNGFLNITDSRFIGNRRNQTYITRDNSTGGGVLYSNHSSVFLSSTIFESNYAVNGGAIYALSSNMRISDCIFRENDAGEGNGGSLYGHHNNSFDILSSILTRNRGYSGAGLSSLQSRRINLVNTSVWENESSRSCTISIMNGNVSVQSCEFRQNTAGIAGGALCVNTANLALNNSSFIRNNAPRGGACFFEFDSIVHASRLFFNRNEAREYNGGGIYLSARSRLTLEDSRFLRNSALLFGGALFAIDGTWMSLRRVTFLYNTGTTYGGAIYAEEENVGGINMYEVDSTVNIDSCEFRHNAATFGGCINMRSVARSTVTNCLFCDNVGLTEAGVIFAFSSNMTLESSRFCDNRAGSGGVLYLQSSSNGIISHCTFENNTATQSGGVIYSDSNSVFSLSNSSISGDHFYPLPNRNSAKTGGSFHLIDGSAATISNCEITNNSALSNGGVLYSLRSTVSIHSAKVESNNATRGGALLAFQTTLEVVNSLFETNHAGQDGGVMHLEQSNANVTNTTMQSNDASVSCGGICALDASHIQANGLLLQDNHATNAGGGIIVANASSLLCYSCMISNNKAFNGAGLYAYSNNSIPVVAQLQNSIFENNSAQTYGGGLELDAPANRSINCTSPTTTCGHVLLLNTSFVDNYASHSGAAVLTTDPRSVLVGCEYEKARNQDFLTERQFSSLELINPTELCGGWSGNTLATNGLIVGTYGQEIVLSMSTNHKARLRRTSSTEYVLENVSSGQQLPNISITIFDGYGMGPAPSSPYSFGAQLSSPDGFFRGLYAATIIGGSGNFSNVVGFVSPRNYTIEVTSDNAALEILSCYN